MEFKNALPLAVGLGLAAYFLWPKESKAASSVSEKKQEEEKSKQEEESEDKKEEEKPKETDEEKPKEISLVAKFLQAFGYVNDYKECINNEGQWAKTLACEDALLEFKNDFNDVAKWLLYSGELNTPNKLELNKNINETTENVIKYVISKIESDENIKCIGLHEEANTNCATIWQDIVSSSHKYVGSDYNFQWSEFEVFPSEFTIAQAFHILGYIGDWNELVNDKWEWIQDKESAQLIKDFQHDFNVIQPNALEETGVLDDYTITALAKALDEVHNHLGDPYEDFKSCMPMNDVGYLMDDELVDVCAGAWNELVGD